MSLSVTNVSDNPQQPSISAEAYIPDQLIAGNLKLVTESVTLTGAAALLRGAVLGKTVTAGTGTATAGGSNSGNGVMGAVTVAGAVKAGNYAVKITKAAANAGDFEVYDPSGDLVGLGTVAVAFAGGGLSFTLADGSADFIVGDSFAIAVTALTEKYKLATLAATDGSNVPRAILADAADPSGGDVSAPIYQMGEFNANALSFGTGLSAALVKSALRDRGIFIKDVISASDPT
jgi:hypothetical protein